jgi:uncharacterized membrane protein
MWVSQCGIRLSFFQIGLLCWVEKHMYLSECTTTCVIGWSIYNFFSNVRIELMFESNTSCNLGVSRWG